MTISAWKAFVEQARDGDIRPYARLAESVLESMDANIVAAFRANHASQATREMA
jgi:hypothetical protein